MPNDEFTRAQTRITHLRGNAFRKGVADFIAGIGLRRWHPLAYPVQIAYFGHARHWKYGRYGYCNAARIDSPEIEHLDHQVYLGTSTGRLAVIMSWPYQTGDVVRAYTAAALPAPRFHVGVDNGCEPLNPGSNIGVKGERTPSSIYLAESITGWVVADCDTLGAERAAEIVRAFLAGDHGLTEAAAEQRALDLEEYALYEARDAGR